MRMPPAATVQRARAAVALALLAAAVAGGCRESARDVAAVPVPDPNLAGVEPLVVEMIHQARAAVAASPRSAEAWGEYGIALEAHGFDAAAATCYVRAADLDPNQVRWPYLAAHALTDLDPAAAMPHFERAADLDPRSALIGFMYGDALLQAGQDAAAQAQYERALQLDPRARRALLGLGEIALRRGELDEARRHLEQAAQLDYFDREVHAKLARLYRRLDDDEAAELQALLVRAYPGLAPIADPHHAVVEASAVSVKALTQRGLAAIGAGRLDDAERIFWDALKARPDSVQNRLNLAGVLVRQRRLVEAENLLRAALESAPDDPDVHNTYAVLLLQRQQLDAAAQHLRTAIGIDPTHDEALVNLARVLAGQGDPDKAIEACGRAIEVNPVNVPAHRQLATLLEQAGRRDEAVEHWRRAALFGRFSPDVTLRFAVATAQRGLFAPALDALRRGLEQSPDDVPMMAALVTILATCPLERYRSGPLAVQWAERLVARTGARHVPSLNLLAAAQAEQGDFDGAILTSERALALARAEGNTSLSVIIEARLALYRVRRPYHQPLTPDVGPSPR